MSRYPSRSLHAFRHHFWLLRPNPAARSSSPAAAKTQCTRRARPSHPHHGNSINSINHLLVAVYGVSLALHHIRANSLSSGSAPFPTPDPTTSSRTLFRARLIHRLSARRLSSALYWRLILCIVTHLPDPQRAALPLAPDSYRSKLSSSCPTSDNPFVPGFLPSLRLSPSVTQVSRDYRKQPSRVVSSGTHAPHRGRGAR